MSKPPQTRGTGRSQAIGTVKDRMLAIQSLKDELMTKDEEIVLSNKPPPYVAEIIANAVDNLPLLIAVVTENGDVTYASQRFSVIDGIRSDLTSIAKLEMLFPVGLADRIEQLPLAANYLLAEGVDLNMHHTDGSLHTYYVVKTLASPSIMRKGHLGDAGNHMIIGMDVTADRQAQHSIKDHKSRINYMVYHDPLTGLANRSLFYDRTSRVLEKAVHNGDNFALLLLDIDRFKSVNDSLGHDAGDAMLKAVSDLLTEELRETDSIARLGADEFVIVLEGVRSIADVECVANRTLKSLNKPLRVHGHELNCSASMGISFYPRDGEAIDQLLKHADIAKQRAKQSSGQNRVEFFLQEMNSDISQTLLLENDLRRAIDNNEMELHYQPQIDLASGKVIGLEALVRWKHPERGNISPMDFIPIAEEVGLIVPLGHWVLQHACERFQHWLASGYDFGRIAVNLSAKQFRMRRFDLSVTEILNSTGLPPQYLELEITESSAMENADEAIHMLNCLSSLGLSLSIDDFGTGYSSLAYLRRFPINKLKIDRSFIGDILDEVRGPAIAKSIIDLAQNLNLEVIAEGVEHLAQSQWLLQKGCNKVQGFYYSRPLPEEKLLEWIHSGSIIKEGNQFRMCPDSGLADFDKDM